VIRQWVLLLACAGFAFAAQGQAPAVGRVATSTPAGAESGPAWNTLPPAHQAALAPLKQHWPAIDASRKAKWLIVAQRFPTLPAVERQRVQARMAEWAAMTPAERGRARQNFQELRNLPHDDRQALWEAYRALPDEQKQQLAQRAKPAAVKAPEPALAPSGKRTVAVNPAPVVTKPVSPTVVQAKPGATTTLVTKSPSPPAHHQPGLPKIAATEGFVNPTTLLPNRGPQGAATHSAAASANAVARP
jgi:Protein of unknown function (DUF3106)